MSAAACPFVWYELMTADANAGTAFYAQVVGWRSADAGMPGRDYTLLSAGDTPVAGLMALTDEMRTAGARPGWVGYVAVADVDGQSERVRQAGGRVHKGPEDIPGVGRFAVVADPQGAVFCLFKADMDAPPSLPFGAAGTVGWHELHAGDLAGAWPFYRDQFGWTEAEALDMGPMGVYQLFAAGSQPIGGMMTKRPEVPQPFWLFYVNVAAIDAAVERVKAGGGQVVNGPMQVPGGSWIVNAIDPQGAMFALVAPTR